MSSEPVEIENEQAVKKTAAKKPAKPKAGKRGDKGKLSGKRQHLKFSINCAAPVTDEIFDINSFEKFLHERIKVNGKTGVLGDIIGISTDSNTVNVTAKNAFSKRYLKYLTKKFLKKQNLRDYIRVVSSNKNAYDLRYFNIHNEAEEDK